MATETIKVCSECPPDDPSETLDECIVCGEPTCGWHGKEYKAMNFNGVAHHTCRDCGLDY